MFNAMNPGSIHHRPCGALVVWRKENSRVEGTWARRRNSKTRPITTRRNKTVPRLMGRMTAHFLHVHSAWLRPWVGARPRLDDRTGCHFRYCIRHHRIKCGGVLAPRAVFAELAWLGYFDENWRRDTSLLNIHNFEEGETLALDTAALRAHRLARQPIAVGPRLESAGLFALPLRQQAQHLGTMLGRAPGYSPPLKKLDRCLPLELKYCSGESG